MDLGVGGNEFDLGAGGNDFHAGQVLNFWKPRFHESVLSILNLNPKAGAAISDQVADDPSTYCGFASTSQSKKNDCCSNFSCSASHIFSKSNVGNAPPLVTPGKFDGLPGVLFFLISYRLFCLIQTKSF